MINDYDARLTADLQFKQFLTACDDLAATKFLFAEPRISALLQTIATCESVRELFRRAAEGFNWPAEYSRSRGRGKNGKMRLDLPKNQVRFVAYVFCLLLEFDTNKRNLKEFLDEFFYSPNPNDAFAAFVEALVVPFRDHAEYLFVNGIETVLSDEGALDALKDNVKSTVQELNVKVAESALDPAAKQDLFAFSRAILNALTPNKLDLLRPLVIGLKNSLLLAGEEYARLGAYVEKLDRLFAAADLY